MGKGQPVGSVGLGVGAADGTCWEAAVGFGVMRVGYVWCESVCKSRCSTLQGDVWCCLSQRLEPEAAGCIRNLELMTY